VGGEAKTAILRRGRGFGVGVVGLFLGACGGGKGGDGRITIGFVL
jgi:hypothetical protein